MQTHYFQRYHSKENVDTANAILLLSRLYLYSSNKFFDFLSQIVNEKIQDFDVELKFTLQHKAQNSVLDASIVQDSFKIAVETKLYNNFSIDQLTRHLVSLKGYKYQIMLTLDPKEIVTETEQKIAEAIGAFNQEHNCNIVHVHLTFKDIIENIRSLLTDRDTEMLDMLEDYEQYCNDSGLLPDDWKTMRMVLVGTTFEDNIENKLYYHGRNKGYSAHKYIGLYKDKSIRSIGEVKAIIDSVFDENGVMSLKAVDGVLTEEIKQAIYKAIEDSKSYGYALDKEEHRFFIVDKFYATDFKKITPRAPMGHRYFDLCKILGTDTLPKDVSNLAALLAQKEWE